MKIQVSQDLGAGLIFLGFGAIFSLGAGKYSIGTPDQMGPGFLPLCVGLFVSAIGIALVARAIFSGSERTDLYPIPLAILCGAICVFALTFSYLGLIPAAFLLAALCARASSDFTVVTAVLVGIALSVLTAALFIWGLGLPLNAWPSIRM
jgi:hypothetical protein